MTEHILFTGQTNCFDSQGREIPCSGSGQDGESQPGLGWPSPRFTHSAHGLVQDLVTGLIWPEDGGLFPFPLTWQEAFEEIAEMNIEGQFGRTDWRLPNRRELRSLIDHNQKKPALPATHLFRNIFLGWYWSSTTSAMSPRYAWYVHFEGGRMFYGEKTSQALLLPVCGTSEVLPATGQHHCYDDDGRIVDDNYPFATGQDGYLRRGVSWPQPRFIRVADGYLDKLTQRTWHPTTLPGHERTSWNEALLAVAALKENSGLPWRLPSINELESLVDASRHSPALPVPHPFGDIQEAYWSSTTSFFEKDWAYVLYLHKGAVGVGFKANKDFSVWPVLTTSLQSTTT